MMICVRMNLDFPGTTERGLQLRGLPCCFLLRAAPPVAYPRHSNGLRIHMVQASTKGSQLGHSTNHMHDLLRFD